MAERGKAKVTINEEALKEKVRQYLAAAWDEGFKARHSGGVVDPSDPSYIVYGPNPYRR